MLYRVCKAFEIESGHMLSKHPDRCRFPHGHSRRVELVLAAESLDENDMVCDFKALKLSVAQLLDDWDHAMAINSEDPSLGALRDASGERLIVFENEDPTTEVLARRGSSPTSAAGPTACRRTSASNASGWVKPAPPGPNTVRGRPPRPVTHRRHQRRNHA